MDTESGPQCVLLLFRVVLRKDLDLPLELVWAKRPTRLPTVPTKEKARQAIAQLTGVHRLIVQLLYGSGVRLMECMNLRVKARPERSDGTRT
ncbi:hypothetical protein ACFLWA_11835 [Chloroflexota bacterium]